MRHLIRLAIGSALNRKTTLLLTLMSVTLACTLLISVERISRSAYQSFTQSGSGTDLIVGSRGSPQQLVLSTLFHWGDQSTPIRWESVVAIRAMPEIAWSIPLSIGDSHRGFPVLATHVDFFRHFQGRSGTPLSFTQGGPFSGLFDAVIGSELAHQLNYQPGTEIELTHGTGTLTGPEHHDKPFTIRGVLAPTGTAIDRTILISLEAMEAIHLDWQAGMPMNGISIPPSQMTQLDLTPTSVNALLIGLHQRTQIFTVQRRINEYSPEPLQAVLPGIVLEQFWESLSTTENIFRILGWLIWGLVLTGLASTLLAGLGERRRELAILRVLGATPSHIRWLIGLETTLLSACGVFFSLLLTSLFSWGLAPWLANRWGIILSSPLPDAREIWLLLSIILSSLLASLWPAHTASSLTLADGLTQR